MIDFKKVEETVLHEFKGGKGDMLARMYIDNKNRIMKCKLKSGASIGLHRHETSSEIIFIISGTGKAVLDGVEEILTADVCHYCKKGQEHTLINNGEEDLVFYAVVPEQ